MGWWWSSQTKQSPVAPSSSPTPLADGASAETPLAAPVPEPVKPVLSREEQSNLEFAELWKELQAEIDAGPQYKSKPQGAKAPFEAVPVPADISPDSLYPTELSCRSAFDYAMFCQSFGGQFVNIYRYGTFRSCSNHWDDFWTCMRTRNWDDKDRAKAIQDHYRKKAVKWKTGPSSEDVWEVREQPVKDAFQGNLEELEARIAQWQKANPGAPDPWQKGSKPSFNTSSIARV